MQATLTRTGTAAHAGGAPARAEGRQAAVLVLPALAVVVLVLLYPLAFNLALAFQSWSFYAPADQRGLFVGIANFASLLADERVQSSIVITVAYAVSSVGSSYVAGLLIALLLQAPFRGRRLFQTIFLLPLVIAPVVIGLQWNYLLSGSFGVINYGLSMMGVTPPNWLAEPGLALPVVVAIDVWTAAPFVGLVLLAGMSNVSPELYEAARADGASSWQQIRSITLPLLAPATALVLVLRVGDVIKAFDLIYILTGGGPASSTEVLGLQTYRVAFGQGELGRAAALGVVIALLSVVAAALLLRLVKTQDRVL